MLQAIRDRASGIIAWVIVIMLIVPFALWGIYDYFSGGGEIYVARVNDANISPAELDRAYQAQRQRLQSLLGANFDPAMFDADRMKRDVLEGLIQRQLLLQEAARAGYWVSDAQLAETIRSMPELQENGRFSQANYEAWTRVRGMTPAAFEASQRQGMILNQLYRGVSDTALVTPAEIDQAIRLKEQERELVYLLIPAAKFKEAVEISEQDIEDYYNAHLRDFLSQEKVQVAYLDLGVKEIAKGVTLSEQELREAYEAQRGHYVEEEKRRASHILIPVAQDANDEEVAAARAQIEKLQQRLESGESFADLAKAFSQDPGSASQGGDLGFFGKGVMDPAFEEAAFALEKGQVSEPVRSRFGFHLILVTDIKPEQAKTFEEVRDELAADLRRKRAEHDFYGQAETLQNLAYEHPDTLEPAAETLGLTVQTSDWFTRDEGTDIAADARVRGAAFGDEVLGQGFNSEPLQLSDDHILVLRVKEHKPATQRPLDEVRDEVVAVLRDQRMHEKAKTVGEEILDRLAEGADLDTLTKEQDVEAIRPGFVQRTGSDVAPAIVQKAFTLEPPPEGGASRAGLALANGDYVVLLLTAVRDGDPAKVSEEVRQGVEDSLRQAESSRSFDRFVAELRRRGDIFVDENRL